MLDHSPKTHDMLLQKTKKTTTKQKNETETEKATVVEAPTAGQRAVGFRTLAIIGVAAACGLSAFEVPTHPLHPASLRHSSRQPGHATYLHTSFHPALLTTPVPLAGPHACQQHGNKHDQPDLVQPKLALLDCGPSSPV